MTLYSKDEYYHTNQTTAHFKITNHLKFKKWGILIEIDLLYLPRTHAAQHLRGDIHPETQNCPRRRCLANDI